MWARNFLFIGLLIAGFVGIRAGLALPTQKRWLDSSPTFTQDSPYPISAEVDRLLERGCVGKGGESVDRAEDLAILRRVTLALTGTIPSVEEIRQFEAGPEDRLVRWVDHLLRERRSADYLAERLARVYVGTEDGPFLIYRRRRFVCWVSDQLLANRRYDGLVRELLTAEGLWTDHPATNFLTVAFDPQTERLDSQRLAGRTARAFLGIRLDCAQCHDHPYQPWTKRDFQGIAAYFDQTRSGPTGLWNLPDRAKKAKARGERRSQVQSQGKTKGGPEREVSSTEPRVPYRPEHVPAAGSTRARLAAWVTSPANPNFSRAIVNRIWALLFGRPLSTPVDDLSLEAELSPALIALAKDFTEHGHDLHRLIKVIIATEAFQRESRVVSIGTEIDLQLLAESFALFPMTPLRPEQVVGGVIQASSLTTMDDDSPILVRLARSIGEREFVNRHGDPGEAEMELGRGTIPQRLLMLNGKLVAEKTKDNLFNASRRIASLAPDDRTAVETAYLAVLTRRPTQEERAHFERNLAATRGKERTRRMTDLFWVLINSTEFSWNH